MKQIALILVAVLTWAGTVSAEDGQPVVLEDFEAVGVGDLPAGWLNKRASGEPATYDAELRSTYNYQVVEEDGNRFLRFDGQRGKHLLLPTGDDSRIDLDKTPVLSWRWRIHQAPTNGSERKKDLNDSAAGIYVIFGRNFYRRPKALKYSWSTTLPAGTRFAQRFGGLKVEVVGSGDDSQGEWVRFERDLRSDYREHFGSGVPERPVAILILSDADDTHSHAVADYDDLALLPAPRQAAAD